MKRTRRFHRQTPAWCRVVLLIAAVVTLPGKQLLVAKDAPAAPPIEKENAAPTGTAGETLPASPLGYNAISNTKVYPKPPLPRMGPAGCIIVDPTFGCPIVRVSDETTSGGDPIITPAGGVQDTFNTDSTLFIVQTGATRPIPFQFDPKTMKVSRIAGLDLMPGIGGDTPFSCRDKNVCYGKDARRAVIVKFDFATKTATDVLEVAKVTGLEPAAGHLGAFSLSAEDSICLTFGGPGQNRDMYCLWYDLRTGKRHVWDTEKGTLDGQPVPNAPHFLQHASGIDHSGRFISVAPSRGANVPWVWDVEKGIQYPMDNKAMGHRAAGYGDIVNDEHVWLYRKLDAEGIKTFVQLMEHPAGEPYFQYDSHLSWNNARPDKQVPILIDTYHIKEMTDPKCAWGDEIIAVATDGSKKVWRFAHNRSNVHIPTRGADGQKAMPTDRTNMAASQAYNFWDTPRGNVSQDGRFFMFTSNWEDSVGKDRAGRFREDVFIVRLDREGAADIATPASEIPAPKPSPPAAADKPAAGGPRTPGASAGKAPAAGVDMRRVRQLLTKQRSGQELTPDEQAYLEQVKKAREESSRGPSAK